MSTTETRSDAVDEPNKAPDDAPEAASGTKRAAAKQRIAKVTRRRYRKSDPRYTPEHDFKWRAKIRANPHSHRIYQWCVFAVGLVVVVLGLLMVPLPGPGWLVVIFGLLIWASEFERAQRVLDFVRDNVRKWNAWVMRRSLIVRALIGLATMLFVFAVIWLVFKTTGSIKYVPGDYQDWMRDTLRL